MVSSNAMMETGETAMAAQLPACENNNPTPTGRLEVLELRLRVLRCVVKRLSLVFA